MSYSLRICIPPGLVHRALLAFILMVFVVAWAVHTVASRLRHLYLVTELLVVHLVRLAVAALREALDQGCRMAAVKPWGAHGAKAMLEDAEGQPVGALAASGPQLFCVEARGQEDRGLTIQGAEEVDGDVVNHGVGACLCNRCSVRLKVKARRDFDGLIGAGFRREEGIRHAHPSDVADGLECGRACTVRILKRHAHICGSLQRQQGLFRNRQALCSESVGSLLQALEDQL